VEASIFFGIKTAYLWQEIEFEIIAQTINASGLKPACKELRTKSKRLPKVKKYFGSFILQVNLVAAAVKNQFNHTQPRTSFSVVLILNFIG
jgi:hypothetical protein